MRAYRAYYERGRFVPLVSLQIPEGSQAIVTVLEETTDEVCVRQRIALARLREQIKSCDEPVPEFERVTLREVEV